MAYWSSHWGGASWSHTGSTKGKKGCWRQVYIWMIYSYSTHSFNLGNEAEYI